MSDDSSSDELQIEKVHSQKGPPKFSVVPKDIKFLIKFKNISGKAYSLLEYDLPKGKKLPYIAVIKEDSEKVEDSVDNFPESAAFGDDTVSVTVVRLEDILESMKDDSSLAPYCCFLCKNKFTSLPLTVAHVEIAHPDWQTKYCDPPGYELGLGPGSSHTLVEAGGGFREEASTPTAGLGSSFQEMEEEAPMLNLDTRSAGTDKLGATVHNNRNWFSEMEESFMETVIGKCSLKAREAVQGNLAMDSLEERRAVSKEIIDQTLHYLHGVFGRDNPRKKNGQRVANHLASVYPALYKFDEKESGGMAPSTGGYGLGGVKGLKNLSSTICSRYHDKYLRSKRSTEDLEGQGEDDDVPVRKKGRAKIIYGVIQQKWYISNMPKTGLEALKMAGKISDVKTREELFGQNREAIVHLIKNAETIGNFLSGFFEDKAHLKGQFEYLTETDISDIIRKGLDGHLENLEHYLLHVNSGVEFMEVFEKVVEDCSLEFDGAVIHKKIHLLRWAGDSFDGEGCGSVLLRLESDGPPKSASPYIYAARVGMHYNFELWAEGKRILHNMDLADALSAFLHLAFTFNLKYPQKAEYLCDFLQHVVAEYGDEDGTRTSKAKTTAENKRMRYYVQLGKALGMKNVRK